MLWAPRGRVVRHFVSRSRARALAGRTGSNARFLVSSAAKSVTCFARLRAGSERWIGTIDPQRTSTATAPASATPARRSARSIPYEFYKLVPAGVTLVITTLTVIERSQSEVDAAYEMSMRAARELAAAGVNLVFFGGVPINLSRGDQNAQAMLRTLASELGVRSPRASPRRRRPRRYRLQEGRVAHPYGAHEDARLTARRRRYGCEVVGVMGCGKVIKDFGRIPVTAALDMGAR